MEINSKTKLKDIVKEYPFIKSKLYKIDEKFKMLNTPMGKIMLQIVDISMMSKKAGIDEKDLIEKINMLVNEANM